MTNVHVLGSVNMDLVARVARHPRPGETVAGSDLTYAPGGKGANQAVAAARLGARVRFVGRVGDDGFGRTLVDCLTTNGVDVADVGVEADAASGVALITVDADGQNCIVIAPGANGRVGAGDVDRLLSGVASGDVVLLQLEISLDAVADAAARVAARGGRVILDPAPAPAEPLPAGLYRDAEVMTPNQSEAAQLLRRPVDNLDDARAAVTALRDLGVRVPLIKLGGDGVVYAESPDGSPQHAPALAARVVDTVAAGDAFNGGLAAALAAGLSLGEAVRWGSAAGSLCVERAGAMNAMPRRDELLARLDRAPQAGGPPEPGR